MSRQKRVLRKKYIVFCEGDTEYNYIDGMRLRQGVELALKPINMHGGGYSQFLEEIKKEASNNCLAKFIIIDFDRVAQNEGELSKLKEIIDYCKIQNNSNRIPHFLILNNPNFEYIACLHIGSYQGQSIKGFIERNLNFGNVEKFKAKQDIYKYLNSNENSQNLMCSRLKEPIIIHHYKISKKSYEIRIFKVDIKWENGDKSGSNINELFEVIDW